MQRLQADFFAAYRSLRLTRDANGVLVAEFHNNDGPFTFTAQAGSSSGHLLRVRAASCKRSCCDSRVTFSRAAAQNSKASPSFRSRAQAKLSGLRLAPGQRVLERFRVVQEGASSSLALDGLGNSPGHKYRGNRMGYWEIIADNL
jgi:hypothetical protein